METTVNGLEDMCGLMCDNMLPVKDHEFCLRCGRKLKNPKARELGYGVVCFKKKQVEDKRKASLFN